jgi:mannose-6-phosphate isomerase-like protein (cupin superfamily)
MQRAVLERCHDGVGGIAATVVVDGKTNPGRHLNFMHHDVIPAGASIGAHAHSGDEEYYYVLAGRGVMTLDGVEHALGPGDLTAVFPGGRHGLENRSGEDLVIIVFSVH